MAKIRHVIPTRWEVAEGVYTQTERDTMLRVLGHLRTLVKADIRGECSIEERDHANEGTPDWVEITGPLKTLVRWCAMAQMNPSGVDDRWKMWNNERQQPRWIYATSKAEYDELIARGWHFSYGRAIHTDS